MLNSLKTKEKAVFLDRDGTINEDCGYINHESRFYLLPNAIEALKMLSDNHFKLIVITNQAGIAKGFMSEGLVLRINDMLREKCLKEGVVIDDIYYCPHDKHSSIEKYKVDCQCRKPKIGMITSAMDKFDIDLNGSYLVGDKYIDMETGWNAGVKPILVKTGYGLGEYQYGSDKWTRNPEYIAEDLLDAAKWIISHEISRKTNE